MRIKLQSLKAFPTDWFSTAEPEHLNTGADADEIRGRSEVRCADGSDSAGIAYTLREEEPPKGGEANLSKTCWGEIYDNSRTDWERADWIKEEVVVGFWKEKGWARTILSYHRPAVGRILAVYLPKQPESVGHGGPSSKSVSNRPCARTVRRGLLIAPNTNANGAQLYWLTIKDPHQPLLQIKGTVQRMSSAYTNCYKTPFSN